MKIPKSLLKQRSAAKEVFSIPNPVLRFKSAKGGYEIDRNSRSCGVEKKELALSSVSLELIKLSQFSTLLFNSFNLLQTCFPCLSQPLSKLGRVLHMNEGS